MMYGRHLQGNLATVSPRVVLILYRFWPAASRKTQNDSYMLYLESGKEGQGEGLERRERGR